MTLNSVLLIIYFINSRYQENYLTKLPLKNTLKNYCNGSTGKISDDTRYMFSLIVTKANEMRITGNGRFSDK